MNTITETLNQSSRRKPGSRKTLSSLDPGFRRGDECRLDQRFLNKIAPVWACVTAALLTALPGALPHAAGHDRKTQQRGGADTELA